MDGAAARARRVIQLGALLVAFAGCFSASEPPPPLRNVLLIVIDTLRADHVGAYGARRDTTPVLDRFAREGTRFDRAYSTAPWTVPAVASILTGLYPSAHGTDRTDHSLVPEVDTLAEILADRGYATAGVISHMIIWGLRGFAQGFARYDQQEARLGDEYVSTAGVTSRAIALLEEFASEEVPFFLFAHYFDPHYRYINHEDIKFAPARAGRLDGTQPIWVLRRMEPELRSDEVAFLVDLYDEEIRHTDAGIGRLLSKLDALGLRKNTVVVVTADHGEEFLERGWLGHTRTLYEELIRVPLIVRAPGHVPSVVRDPVSVVSIVPTVLDLIGVDPSRFRFDGESLVPHLGGAARPGGREVFAEVDYEEALNDKKRAFKKAVIDGDWKLIQDDLTRTVELYDLKSDAAERRDLSSSRPEVVQRLVGTLERHLARGSAPEADPRRPTLSPAEIEQLRILGYMSPEET